MSYDILTPMDRIVCEASYEAGTYRGAMLVAICDIETALKTSSVNTRIHVLNQALKGLRDTLDSAPRGARKFAQERTTNSHGNDATATRSP